MQSSEKNQFMACCSIIWWGFIYSSLFNI